MSVEAPEPDPDPQPHWAWRPATKHTAFDAAAAREAAAADVPNPKGSPFYAAPEEPPPRHRRAQ